jgi:hypothetical protein
MPARCAEYWDAKARWWADAAGSWPNDKPLQRLMLDVSALYSALARLSGKVEELVAQEDC